MKGPGHLYRYNYTYTLYLYTVLTSKRVVYLDRNQFLSMHMQFPSFSPLLVSVILSSVTQYQ
jgi:hypothetical protein